VRLASIGSGRRVVALFIAKLRKDNLDFLGRLVESRRVKPVIERSYELADVPEALRHMDEGRTQGKVAIVVQR
jgi:NADPH:quinone reductase-like Zn-dependent oxidoreductase